MLALSSVGDTQPGKGFRTAPGEAARKLANQQIGVAGIEAKPNPPWA
jgi:hypothetical protein